MINVAHVQDTLVTRWNTLWSRLDAHGDPLAVFVQLDRLYSHPDRHYHTLTHVAHCLTELDPAVEVAEQAAQRGEAAADARLTEVLHAIEEAEAKLKEVRDANEKAEAKSEKAELKRLRFEQVKAEGEKAKAGRLRFTKHERAVIEAAIWFHDAIIIRECAYNEVLSAALMQYLFHEAGVRPNVIGDIAHCIHRSTHGDPPTRDRMVGTFLDADLAILGQSPDACDAYASRIRSEYGDVPDAQFTAGRIDILRSFLARDRIYGTDFFAERYEQRARENLQREIATLERKLQERHAAT